MKIVFTIIGIGFILFGIALGYFLITSAEDITEEVSCTSDEQCVLSLCDCKCYPANNFPEDLQTKQCSKNCKELVGADSCICQENECKAV